MWARWLDACTQASSPLLLTATRAPLQSVLCKAPWCGHVRGADTEDVTPAVLGCDEDLHGKGTSVCVGGLGVWGRGVRAGVGARGAEMVLGHAATPWWFHRTAWKGCTLCSRGGQLRAPPPPTHPHPALTVMLITAGVRQRLPPGGWMGGWGAKGSGQWLEVVGRGWATDT